MSRIIVKNLPAKASEADVRTHFASKGRITDVRVLRKRDGSSRRFAFVGFSSDEEASAAAQHFNLSFMNSSRLDVALAKAVGDQGLARRKQALKRKRDEQREEQAEHTEKPGRVKTGSKEKDARLEEFLSVMQPQKRTAMWKNDSTDRSAANGQPDNDDEDMNDFATGTAEATTENSGEPEGVAVDSESEAEEPKPVEPEEEEPEWDPTANLNEDEEASADPGMSDMDWLRQRQTRIMENGDKPAPPKPSTEPAEAEPAEAEAEPAPPTNRLFVRNLAYSVEQGDLVQLFSNHGAIKQVHVPIDPKTDTPKGIAFVEFEEVDEAEAARAALDGHSFQGRLLHVLPAAAQRGYVLDEFDIRNMPLKKQKALRRRMQAARQQFSWNALYMRPDTVLEAAAAKLGISKAELMDPTSSNMAVQQALAESSVLESVQSYFQSKGVDLARFEAGGELSDTVLLAKNLPHGTSAPELQAMFAEHGDVARTLMPPDGGIAIVQFRLASAGRQAFKKLAYRRVGDSILYLQKAPKGALPDPDEASSSVEDTKDNSQSAAAEAASAKDVLLPDGSVEDGPDEVRTSVFIKNLSFTTTPAALTALLEAVPGFTVATIKTKPDPKDSSRQQSMGFGFAEFRTRSQAEAAVSALQGHVLDGHALQLKLSSRGQDAAAKSAKPRTAKIVIKNIPFETTKQDVVDLFGTFGQLRSVRVPRKFNRQTRGFAFAEFATPKEAAHALATLRGAHLLGRRLVMDYAAEDAEDAEKEIARMEAKVAKQVGAEQQHGRRLGQQKGFDMDEE